MAIAYALQLATFSQGGWACQKIRTAKKKLARRLTPKDPNSAFRACVCAQVVGGEL